MKICFDSFGCRLNHSETAYLITKFTQNGFQLIDEPEQANLCVVNTCTVTEQSDKKCYQKIRSLRRKNPHAVIAVLGCLSQVNAQYLEQNIPNIEIILGTQEKLNLYDYYQEYLRSKKPIRDIKKIIKNSFQIPIHTTQLQTTRASIKVQDGCSFGCTFCIIPTARGKSRAREIDDIYREAILFSKTGYREIVLTGVNIGTYKYKKYCFHNVVKKIASIPSIQRIRISSIEPTTIGREIFDWMNDPQYKVVPFLHLPLQSASDIILKKMKRRYNLNQYTEFVTEAVEKVKDICIGTDIMAGFPEETEQNFLESYNNLVNLPIHYFHVFPFSRRRNTPAYIMPQVEKKTITQRASLLRKLSLEKKYCFQKKFLQKKIGVLYEKQHSKDIWSGYSENYIRVHTHCTKNIKNQIIPSRVISVEKNCVHAQIEHFSEIHGRQ